MPFQDVVALTKSSSKRKRNDAKKKFAQKCPLSGAHQNHHCGWGAQQEHEANDSCLFLTMIILEEDECTPLKGDSTTPVSPTSPSQLFSSDSPPSYNEAVVCNPFSRHPSYDAIPVPESLSLESLDRVSDTRRRRRNKHRVNMMLLFLALMGCIVFWLTFAIVC